MTRKSSPKAGSNSMADAFSSFAAAVARMAGRPVAFLAALTLVVAWAATGPLVGFSDTWQLIINTSTTIVTFLMVFLIQETQNRDTLALQIKVAELILAIRGTETDLATAEDLSEESLQKIHERFKKAARAARPQGKSRGKPGPNRAKSGR